MLFFLSQVKVCAAPGQKTPTCGYMMIHARRFFCRRLEGYVRKHTTKAAAAATAATPPHPSEKTGALPERRMNDTTIHSPMSDYGTTTSLATAATTTPTPLSKMTLSELSSDTSSAMWDEQVALASQPGVCNLGLGFPDYEGSRLAREAAAEAMVEPTMVSFCFLSCMSRNKVGFFFFPHFPACHLLSIV